MIKNFTFFVLLVVSILASTTSLKAQSNTFQAYHGDTCVSNRVMHFPSFQGSRIAQGDSIIVRVTNTSSVLSDTISVNNYYINPIFFAQTGITSFMYYLWNYATNTIKDSSEIVTSFNSITCFELYVRPFGDVNASCDYSALDRNNYSNVNVFVNGILERTVQNSSPNSSYIIFRSSQYNNDDTISIVPIQSAANCISGNQLDFTFDTITSSFQMLDLPLSCSNGQDFSIQANSNFRTAASLSYVYLYCANNSCDSQSTSLVYTMPNDFSFVSANNPNYTISGNVITFNTGYIHAMSQKTFVVTLQNTDTTMMVGDSVQHYAILGNLSSDLTPNNNVDSNKCRVLGSYDPNQKTAFPTHYLSNASERIEYLVEFENIGTAPAYSVRIMDTLSELLDYNTFRIEGSSHPYNYERNNKFGPNVMNFSFPGIVLADSSDKMNNKGWIKYSVVPKAGLTMNEQIKNTAHIYFDYNPAIVTNTTLNELKPLSIPNKYIEHIAVYPNPVNDILNIKHDASLKTLVISNVIGQSVYRSEITHPTTTTVNMSSLPAGVYTVTCINKEGVAATYKVVKQ